MTEIFVHIGLHKTATTTLQQQLFPECKGLNYIKRPALRRSIYALTTVDTAYFDAEAVRKDILNHVREDQPNLISREALSGASGAGIIKRGLDHRSPIIENLAAAVPEARIILVIRRQDALACSLYRQYLKLGGTEVLGRFFGINGKSLPLAPLDLFRYHPYVERIYRAFPGGILVLTFEEFVYDQKSFINKLTEYMHIEAPELHMTATNQTRLGAGGLEVSRILNRFFRSPLNPGGLFLGIPVWKRNRFKMVSPMSFVHTVWPWKGTLSADSKLKSLGRTILEAVREDNRKLDEEFNLGLDRFGYY